MIFKNAHLIFPDKIEPNGQLRIVEGKIESISTTEIPSSANEEIIDLKGKFLAPGFVDLHIHGALERDTMEATPEAFETICRYHASGGTTALALTTVTAPTKKILEVLEAAKSFQNSNHEGADVLGIHIEGPYFSKQKPGAHDLDLIRNPVAEEYNQFLAYGSLITQITVAPELPGAIELIETLSRNGIIASGGHSDAWDEEACNAFVHGMRQVTHTFNCMSSARRRDVYRVAGLLEFALSEPEMQCELIADGKHVSPTLMRMLLQAKGADRVTLVTDASAGAGLDEEATFKLAEIECVVRDGVGLTADGKALAGSTANMALLVRNMVKLVDVSLVEAVRMATLNPARILRQENIRGQLLPGTNADLVVLSDQLEVEATYVRGNCVFRKN